MKKAECEKALRSLCQDWAKERAKDELDDPSFFQFEEWLRQNGYSQYLDFRATPSARYWAEIWFAEELGQLWRY